MNKVYVAEKKDLSTIDTIEKSLVLKPNTSKLLKDYNLKEIVYLNETINGTTASRPYIIVEKNIDNIVLLRQELADSAQITPTKLYINSTFDTWCSSENGFLNRFSENLKNYFTTKTIKVYSGDPRGNPPPTTPITEINKTVFLPSYHEIFDTKTILRYYYSGNGTVTDVTSEVEEGDSHWFSTAEERKALIQGGNLQYGNYWLRSQYGYMGSQYGGGEYYVSSVTTDGSYKSNGVNTGGPSNTYYRPAIVLSPSTPFNSNNTFEDTIVYAGRIEGIRDGASIYKIKDKDASEAISNFKVKNGNVLQVKKYTIEPKTINSSEISVGATIYVNESKSASNWVAYCLIEQGETYSKLVRKASIASKQINSSGGTETQKGYKDSIIDTYITNTWLPTLSDDCLNCLYNASISIYHYPSGGNININRYAALVSQDEGNLLVTLANTNVGWSRTNADTGSNAKYYYKSGNSWSSTYQYTNKNVFPTLFVNNNSIIDNNNHLVSNNIQYQLSEVDTIQEDTKFYKLKDLDARDSIATLETAVAGKAAASHTHTVSDITDFPSIPTAGTITSGSTGYAVAGDVYTALNKPPYDLCFLAESDSLIDSRTNGATVTNAYLTALVPLDDLLLKSDRYDRVELCGGFHYTDPNLGFLTVVPATLSYNAIIPNQIARQMLPTVVQDATINSKDALLVRITPVYNDDAYQASYVIWEDEDDVRQIAHVGS